MIIKYEHNLWVKNSILNFPSIERISDERIPLAAVSFEEKRHAGENWKDFIFRLSKQVRNAITSSMELSTWNFTVFLGTDWRLDTKIFRHEKFWKSMNDVSPFTSNAITRSEEYLIERNNEIMYAVMLTLPLDVLPGIVSWIRRHRHGVISLTKNNQLWDENFMSSYYHAAYEANKSEPDWLSLLKFSNHLPCVFVRFSGNFDDKYGSFDLIYNPSVTSFDIEKMGSDPIDDDSSTR